MSRTVLRQLLIGTLCCGLPNLVCASNASAQATPPASGTAALEIVNRASVPIAEVRLASRAMSAWGNNLLATHLAPGKHRRVTPERQEGCLYAIRIVYSDNRFERFSVIDLCRNNEYVFAGKVAQAIANQAVYSAPPAAEVTIVNQSPKTISVVRMSPTNERMWGPDRLGNQTLLAGKQFNAPFGDNRGCQYRVYAFYEDNLTEVISPVNLCDDTRVVFRRAAVHAANQLPANMRLVQTSAILVSNQSSSDIRWMYVFPSNRERGRDRLPANEDLMSGRQRRIDVSDLSACVVTVLAVYKAGGEEKQSVDLCAAQDPIVTMRQPSASNSHGGVQNVPSRNR